MLWGIAIADTRVPGYQKATVVTAHTQLSCRVDGKDVILNDDGGSPRGGLCWRHPWFGTDAHDPMPQALSRDGKAVVLPVGQRSESSMAFLGSFPASASSRWTSGGLHGTRARKDFSRGAVAGWDRLLAGFDYRIWRWKE